MMDKETSKLDEHEKEDGIVLKSRSALCRAIPRGVQGPGAVGRRQ